MRLIAPLLFFLLGAAAGSLVALVFGKRGAGVRLSAAAGLIGGFSGLFLRDALDIDLGEVLLGSLLAVLLGGATFSLLVNVAALLIGGGQRRS